MARNRARVITEKRKKILCRKISDRKMGKRDGVFPKRFRCWSAKFFLPYFCLQFFCLRSFCQGAWLIRSRNSRRGLPNGLRQTQRPLQRVFQLHQGLLRLDQRVEASQGGGAQLQAQRSSFSLGNLSGVDQR